MPRRSRSCVCEAARAGEDPGALAVLRAYERWRKSEVALMASAIDAFDRLLAHGTGPLARLAQRAWRWVNRSQRLRRFFIGARARADGRAAASGAQCPHQLRGIRSILAAQMKSFSDSPRDRVRREA